MVIRPEFEYRAHALNRVGEGHRSPAFSHAGQELLKIVRPQVLDKALTSKGRNDKVGHGAVLIKGSPGQFAGL